MIDHEENHFLNLETTSAVWKHLHSTMVADFKVLRVDQINKKNHISAMSMNEHIYLLNHCLLPLMSSQILTIQRPVYEPLVFSDTNVDTSNSISFAQGLTLLIESVTREINLKLNLEDPMSTHMTCLRYENTAGDSF